jgi:hypothetical protein
MKSTVESINTKIGISIFKILSYTARTETGSPGE